MNSVSCSSVVGSFHTDAAAQRSRVKAGAYSRLAQPLQNSLAQAPVHPADQLGQTIEMEGRGPPRYAERLSHLVSTERQGASTYMVIDAPSGWLIQAGHCCDICG